MSIAVVGSGYVGSVVAACFASVGYRVTAVEADPARLAALRDGRAPIHEPGLDELIAGGRRSGRLSFTDDLAAAINGAQLAFLCLGTPAGADGSPDMAAFESAVRAAVPALQPGGVVVTKSTVPIGTGAWIESVIRDAGRADDGIGVAANPEFLREGSAVSDFLRPDRVVIGSAQPHALRLLAEAYRPILESGYAAHHTRPTLFQTDLATAETIKYAANAFLAARISLINEIAGICVDVGADIDDVAAGVGLDDRIGPRFLAAGIGWGGSCFGKDLDSLILAGQANGRPVHMLRAVRTVNLEQRSAVVARLEAHLVDLAGRRVTLLGLAYKPGTDDLRDAPAVDIASQLIERGAAVAAYDPVVETLPGLDVEMFPGPYAAAQAADAVVLITDWPEFAVLDFDRLAAAMKGKLFLDGRNLVDAGPVTAAGLAYEGVGKGRTAGA